MTHTLRVVAAVSVALIAVLVGFGCDGLVNQQPTPGPSPDTISEVGPEDPQAQYVRGTQYARGGNETQAVRWFLLAAAGGHVEAQLALAEIYRTGASAAAAVELIRGAQDRGADVTTEADYWAGQAASSTDAVSPGDDIPRETVVRLLLVSLLAAVLLSLYTNVLLFKWRRRLKEDGAISVVPSTLLDSIDKQSKAVGALSRESSRLGEAVLDTGNASRKGGSELLEAFSSLQTSLSEKDEEIKRLRRGYDGEVFRRFLKRFIRLDNVISENLHGLSQDNKPGLDALADLRFMLDDALAECGLTEFSPEVGESVRTAFGIDENYETRPAGTEVQHLTVAEVLRPGLKLVTPDGPGECVREARVVVFVDSGEAA